MAQNFDYEKIEQSEQNFLNYFVKNDWKYREDEILELISLVESRSNIFLYG